VVAVNEPSTIESPLEIYPFFMTNSFITFPYPR
jgi:hypothetical protein